MPHRLSILSTCIIIKTEINKSVAILDRLEREGMYIAGFADVFCGCILYLIILI